MRGSRAATGSVLRCLRVRASTATARMLDRLGNPIQIPVQVSDRPDSTNQFRWIVVDAALAALAPGDYAIETTLDGVKQVTAFQLVP